MESKLSELFKKYVALFVNEYQDYLSKDQLETLRKINYNNVIEFANLNMPFGMTMYSKVYLSSSLNDVIENLKKMPNYNTLRSKLHNKNLSSYLKYMCDNGYNELELYQDILMYFVFFLVIKNKSSLVYGLINQEIEYLCIKYSIKCASLFAREENVASKITPFLKMEGSRKVIFQDKASSFKYLNDHLGFRYAKLVDDIARLMDFEYDKLSDKEYEGFKGFLDYTVDYDHLSYGDVYNEILDFKVQNSL